MNLYFRWLTGRPELRRVWANDGQGPSKKFPQPTKDIARIKKDARKHVAHNVEVEPKAFFQSDAHTNSSERQTQSEPPHRRKKPRKDDRMLAETAQGKKVLSSEAQLHLEKNRDEKQTSYERASSSQQ